MAIQVQTTPAGDSSFPLSPHDISLEWLNSTMNRTGVFDAEIASIELDPVESGFGVLSDTAILKLRFSSASSGPYKTLFVKSSHQEEVKRLQIHKLGYYEREIFFYREIAHKSGIPVPKCFYASIEPDTGHSLIILEAPDDVRPGDDLAVIANADVENVFAKIATFHAQWWQDPALFQWTCLQVIDGNIAAQVERWNEIWPHFVERFQTLLGTASIETGERIVKSSDGILKGLATSPMTLSHGDFRSDNLLFRDAPRNTLIVDWQTISRAPGASDISRYLISSLPVEQRGLCGHNLIESYCMALVNAGVQDYDRDACIRDISLAAAYNLLVQLSRWLRKLPSERRKRLVAAAVERNFAMIEDYPVWRYIE